MSNDAIREPIAGAEHTVFHGIQTDYVRAGNARVKRIVYQAGMRWSDTVKPHVGTDLCMHSHVGYLAEGQVTFEYPDGAVVDVVAPQFVAIEPGHDAVIGTGGPAVLIEFDFEGDTDAHIGLPHTHDN